MGVEVVDCGPFVVVTGLGIGPLDAGGGIVCGVVVVILGSPGVD